MGGARRRLGVKSIMALFLVLVFVAIFLFLRGPYVSNLLKASVLSRLSSATGMEVTAERIYINVFPLFIGANNIKASDTKGRKIFEVDRVKAYVSPIALFGRLVEIRRLSLSSPRLLVDDAAIDDAIKIKSGREGRERGGSFALDVRFIVIEDGGVSYSGIKRGLVLDSGGISAEVDLREAPAIGFSAGRTDLKYKQLEMTGLALRGNLQIKDGAFQLRDIRVDYDGSSMSASGEVSKGGKGGLNVDLKLLERTMISALGLKRGGNGTVYAKGEVELTGEALETVLDLDLNGNFMLETLVDSVHVNPEHELTGSIDFEGNIKGPLKDIKGSADAKIKNGAFFGVKTKSARCKVNYGDGVLSFKEGDAEIYGGRADVEVSINIPWKTPYTVSVGFKDAGSEQVLGLIDLNWLGLSEGRLTGELLSNGHHFEPAGWFVYTSKGSADGPVASIKNARGEFRKTEDEVFVSGIDASSGKSRLLLDGSVDLKSRALSFSGSVETRDVKDLTMPYYGGLSGSGRVNVSVGGTVEDPHLEGKISMNEAELNSLRLGAVTAKVAYRKDLLEIKSASADENDIHHRAKGSVSFPKAKNILEITNPDYDLDVTLKAAELKEVLDLMGHDVPVEGAFDSEFKISGSRSNPVFSGKALIANSAAYGRSFDSASFDFSFDLAGAYRVKDATARKGVAELRLDGKLDSKGGYDFRATARGLSLREMTGTEIPVEYKIDFEAGGRGSIEKPVVDFKARLSEGTYMGIGIGGGMADISLRDGEISFESYLLQDRVKIEGRTFVREGMPWTANVKSTQGRFGFLLMPYLKAPPEDMFFSVTGEAKLRGDIKHIYTDAVLSKINLNMFEQGFSNDSNVIVSVRDSAVSVSRFLLRSGNTSLAVGGEVEVGGYYAISLKGKTSLAPLAAFIEDVESVGGASEFSIEIGGEWESPRIKGAVLLSDGSFAIKNLPQHFTAVNGYIYFDNDRATIEDVKADFGGGSIRISGTAFFKGLDISSLLLDASIRDVTMTASRGLDINVGGDLFMRLADASRGITGELLINRASYVRRIEWKSWLVSAGREEAPKGTGEWADSVDLNIRLTGKENIRVNNNIATAPIMVDLVLRGTLGNPFVVGRLESSSGKVYFRNSELNILSATADFSELRINDPFVVVSSETTIQGYRIQLGLQGRKEQFDLSLSSDPPLEDVEILALLTLGEFGEDLEGIEGGIGAAEATSFITGKFQDVLENRFKDITGLDRFQIDPYVSKSTGTVTPRVTVSKRLMGDKLLLKYSSSMTSSEEQELKVEYILDNNVSLVGGREDDGSLGGDITFRLRFR